jgi:hypothetical protein
MKPGAASQPHFVIGRSFSREIRPGFQDSAIEQ